MEGASLMIQFEKDRMFFGQQSAGRPQLNGFWLEPEHCSVCAPKEARYPHSRCERHASFLWQLTMEYNERCRGKGADGRPTLLELGPEEYKQFCNEMTAVEDRMRLVPASGSCTMFKGLRLREVSIPGVFWSNPC